MHVNSIKMFIMGNKDDNWICDELLTKAIYIQRIYRFHSRILPNRIKWEKIFLLNIEISLF